MNYLTFIGIFFLNNCNSAKGRGLLLLYRPNDVTVDCAFSKTLRYDLSFGMGLSDTTTVIFRTLADLDYECQVDIVTESVNTMIVVLKFPATIGVICETNPLAFQVLKMSDIYPICTEEHIAYQDVNSKYWHIYTKGRFRFQYKSNSSINNDLGADLYSVTATTARLRRQNERCVVVNETDCYAAKTDEYYCMTSGVVCDGIKNCGISGWYDERTSECDVPVDRLNHSAVCALLALLAGALLAGAHALRSGLPRPAAFFIFSTNDENQLCVDCMLHAPDVRLPFQPNEDVRRKTSLIPISSDTSDEEFVGEEILKSIEGTTSPQPASKPKFPTKKLSSVSKRIQDRLRGKSLKQKDSDVNIV